MALGVVGDPRIVANRDGLVAGIRRVRSQLCVSPAGRMLPAEFVDIIRLVLDDRAGCYEVEILQWIPGWAQVRLAGSIPEHQFTGLQDTGSSSTVSGWWIDDIFTPHSQGWWEDVESFYNDQEDAGPPVVLWCGVYEEYPGRVAADAMGVEWILRIPAGALRMRTDQSICQSRLVTRHAVYTRNLYAIRIGCIARDRTTRHLERVWTEWAGMLRQHQYPLSWLLNGWGTTAANTSS